MTAMTIYDAQKFSRDMYGTAFLRSIATSDELFSRLPFVPKSGGGFTYEREVSTGAFSFIAPGGTVANSVGSSERVSVPLREATEDFWIPNFTVKNQNNEGVDPRDRATMQKVKAAGRAIANKTINGVGVDTITMDDAWDTGPLIDALVQASPFVTDRGTSGDIRYTHSGTTLAFRAPGDRDFGAEVSIAGGDGNYTLASSSPSKWITVTVDVSDATADGTRRAVFTNSGNDFPGLVNQISSGQERTSTGSNGDALSFGILDELLDAVKEQDNLAFIMHSTLRRKYQALVRALGGVTESIALTDTLSVPAYLGVPIIKNDWIPTNGTKGGSSTLSSVYLVNLNPENGFYMGAASNSTTLNVEGDPRDAMVMGFTLEELGQHDTNSTQGRRLMWFGSTALGSDLSAASAIEIESA